MAAIGQVIDDKYEILKLIGQGGMSKVYLAMDKRLNKQWAVKEIEKRARDRNNEIVIQSAVAEANMIKQLDHPAIVRIVDIIDEKNVIYIIEDYIEGETLSSILENNGAQPQELVIEWAMQLCSALEYLHTRRPPIVYRDMKPANVMVKPDGNIKVIDFGIAREYKEQGLADTVCLGTRGYAAPEQFGGKGQTDARTDIYCLGATLYHLLTGQNPAEPPYEMYPIRQWNPQLSAGLEAIILKCTQFNPEDRYQSCAELLYALHHYEEYSAAYRGAQKRKLKIFLGTVLACVISLCVGFVGASVKTQRNNSDFEENILLGDKAGDPEEKLAHYIAAVDIKPEEAAGYLGMINVFKEDADFTVEEESILKKKLNANLTTLQQEPEYADLAFEVGKLYWYYYGYGAENGSDNRLTRMKSAIQWFDDAVRYGSSEDSFYTMSAVYRDTGMFNRDITLSIQEATDQGLYSEYWGNIESLLEFVRTSGDENEIVQLEVYRLVEYSIENYARKFRADGISRDDVIQALEEVQTETKRVSTTTEKTQLLKEEIESRFGAGREAVENAYREQVKEQ